MSSVSSTKNTTLPENISWVEHAEGLAKDFRHDDQQEKIERESIVVFQVGTELFGTPISSVKEIVKTPEISKIPQTSPHIVGVTNVRGNILAVLDAELRISGKLSEDEKKFIIVINHDEVKMGVLVRTVPHTVSIDKKSINRSTSVIQNLTMEDQFVSGLVKHEDKMIFLVDLLKMI